MKAIIVSAGQGKRLLPLTETRPKCLLPVDGDKSMLEVQLDALAECGVEHVRVMVGFGAEQVEEQIRTGAPVGLDVQTCFNPFYATSDNLATVWLASNEMHEDFMLINGDTLFEPELLERVLATANAPITVTINRKASREEYDDDDMKVSLAEGGRLTAIGKTLDRSVVDGESAEDLEVVRKALSERAYKPQTPVRDSRSSASD